jgi:hypothetical protein
MHIVVLLIWLKATPGATLMYSPKNYPSVQSCERAAAKVRDHYNAAFDPRHEYSSGNSVDTFCLE